MTCLDRGRQRLQATRRRVVFKTRRRVPFKKTIRRRSTHCAKPLQHASDHHYHSSAIYSSEMEKEKEKKYCSEFLIYKMTVQSSKIRVIEH